MGQSEEPRLEGPRWQRRPAERRREILDAAVLVFGEHGFDCATIAEVARRAGVSTGTVVHYFGSKGDLFESALRERFLEEVAGGEALLASHRGTCRELLLALLTRMWNHLCQPGTADLMLYGLAKAQHFPDTAGLMCREVGERWRRLLAGILTAGIAQGEFRACNAELQARVLGGGLVGMIMGMQHFGRFEPRAPDSEALLAQYLESVDHSLARVPVPTGDRR